MEEEHFSGMMVVLCIIAVSFVLTGWALNSIGETLANQNPGLLGLGTPLITLSFAIVVIIFFNGIKNR